MTEPIDPGPGQGPTAHSEDLQWLRGITESRYPPTDPRVLQALARILLSHLEDHGRSNDSTGA